MTPGRYDPPPIWRGCNWDAITLIWKDSSGNPVNLTGFTPFAQTINGVDLQPLVTGALTGTTMLGGLSNTQTANLKLGKFRYDWIWWQNIPTGEKFPPSIYGVIEIKEPNTQNFAGGGGGT